MFGLPANVEWLHGQIDERPLILFVCYVSGVELGWQRDSRGRQHEAEPSEVDRSRRVFSGC